MRKTYLKYLGASFGSAIILSIYSLVDAICVGQYHGSLGTAALAIIMPIWTIIFSSGLLFGIGGSVLMNIERGKENIKKANSYVTVAFLFGGLFCLLLWITFNLFEGKLLIFFGGTNEDVLSLAFNYTFFMKISLPFFFIGQFISCFIRSDGRPTLATIAVICGGITNMILDVTFVFGLKMGIAGAGLATMLGQAMTCIILSSHFFSKKRSFRLGKIEAPFNSLKEIIVIGFPSFILDIAMGIIAIIFNNQISKYLEGDNATATLAIYGVICNIVALIQSLGYAVGQSSSPLLADSYGKNDKKSITDLLKYGLITCFVITIAVFLVIMLFPLPIAKIFMSFDEASLIASLAPNIIRKYFISIIFIIFNVYATYYFQAIIKTKESFLVSLFRGIILPILLLFILPIASFNLIWYVMPIVEGIIFILNVILLVKNKN